MHDFTKLVGYIAAVSVFWLVGCGTMPATGVSHDAAGDSPDDDASIVTDCATSLVPLMTSATTPSGMVSRSGVYSATYEAWQAFDASNNSMWISGVFETPAWIAYQWTDGPRRVTSYAIDFVNGSLASRAPRDWTFEGWNGTWHVIDTRSAEIGWLGVERRAYTVAFPGSYSAYRLNVSDDNDDRAGVVVVSMGRFELMGCPPPP